MEEGLFVHRWMLDALTLGQAQRWAPWLAGTVVITLLVLSLATDDLSSAGRPDVVVAMTASGLGMVIALPLLLAASRGLSLVALSVVLATTVPVFFLLLLYLAFQVALAHLSYVPISSLICQHRRRRGVLHPGSQTDRQDLPWDSLSPRSRQAPSPR